MRDLTLQILAARKGWWVELEADDARPRTRVEALVDADLADLADLPPRARTWTGLLRALATTPPALPVLKQIGSRILDRLLGDPTLRRALEDRLDGEVRLVLEVDDTDPELCRLPLELMFGQDRFFFRQPGMVGVRTVPNTPWKALVLPDAPRILIATAHHDREARPTREELAEHGAALAEATRALGWEPTVLPDATPDALRAALLAGADVLYVACHGLPDPDQAGQLLLRDRSLTGAELGEWLDEAAASERPVAAVVLCACSSAAPGEGPETAGMAQYLARRTVAAVGFQAPVRIDWALPFTRRLLESFAGGDRFDAAFCASRRAASVTDPQWALPVLYIRRTPPGEVSRGLGTLPKGLVPRAFGVDPRGLGDALRSLTGVLGTPQFSLFGDDAPDLPRLASVLPAAPVGTFVARSDELDRLEATLDGFGAAPITVLEGQGGVGKTELARVFAWRAHERGLPVLWMERPDANPTAALVRMIQSFEPDFRPAPTATLADLSERARAGLGRSDGLMVLDDVADGAALDPLLVDGWHALVTTRVRALRDDADRIELDRLPPEDAVALLRAVLGQDGPAEGLDALAEALEGRPLALDLAGHTLREQDLPPAAYLASLRAGVGPAAEDQDVVARTLLRALADLADEARALLELLARFPRVGVRARELAHAAGRPEPAVLRHLGGLVRGRLAEPDEDRFRLHPLVRERLRRRPDPAAEAAATGALLALARWIHEPLQTHADEAWGRWRATGAPLLDLDPTEHPGAAEAVAITETFVQLTLSGEARLARLDAFLAAGEHPGLRCSRGDVLALLGRPVEAEQDYDRALAATVDDPLGEAHVLGVRALLLRRTGHLARAEQDLDRVMILLEGRSSPLSEANALFARGALRMTRSRFDAADADLTRALARFEEVGSVLGQANALHALGLVHQRSGDPDRAAQDFERALALARGAADRLGEANALQGRAGVREARGDVPGALADLDAALEAFRAVGDPTSEADTLRLRGEIRGANGIDGAVADLEAARERFEAAGSALGQGHALQSLGDLLVAQGRTEAAIAVWERADLLYEAVGDDYQRANIAGGLALAWRDRDPVKAAAHARAAKELGERTANDYALGVAAEVLAG